MFYCAIQGFATGNTANIWRATDENGNICGDMGTTAENYKFSYLYNPLSSTDNRVCVTACPKYESGSISPLDCFTSGCPAATSGYGVISEDGQSYTTGSASSTYLLYGSDSLLDRICIPNSNVFTGTLSSALDSFYSAVSGSTFADFVTDIMKVKKYLILELAMATRSFWSGSSTFLRVDVCLEMSCRMYRLGFYFWDHWNHDCFRSDFPVQCR